MPFENRFARVFSTESVQRDAPACSGVYGLSDAGQWIYVGETGNIQDRLLELLEEKSTFAFLGGRTPTGFSFEICPSGGRIARQDRLVHELEPIVNRRPWSKR